MMVRGPEVAEVAAVAAVAAVEVRAVVRVRARAVVAVALEMVTVAGQEMGWPRCKGNPGSAKIQRWSHMARHSMPRRKTCSPCLRGQC